MEKKTLLYELVHGTGEINPVIIEKETNDYIWKLNYKNFKIEKHKKKGKFRSYFDSQYIAKTFHNRLYREKLAKSK